jgi:hypothetical protein
LNDYDILYDWNSMDNLEVDYGMCNNYLEMANKCVTGHNMEKLYNVTLPECQYHCSKTIGCLGVEYYRKSGARNAEDIYVEGQCNLSDSLITDGCDAGRWQMYLWRQ